MKNLKSGYYWLIEKDEPHDAKIALFDSDTDCWTFCGSDLFYTTNDIIIEYTVEAQLTEP